MEGKMSNKAKRKIRHFKGGVSRATPKKYNGKRPLQCSDAVLKIKTNEPIATS